MLIVTMEEREKTASGIILPKTSLVEWVWGEVVGVHDGAVIQNGTTVPCEYRVGDRVMYQKLQAMLLEITGYDKWVTNPVTHVEEVQCKSLYLIREVAIGMKVKDPFIVNPELSGKKHEN